MEYRLALAETSPLGDQAIAAISFRNQYADGVENVDLLFAAMMRIDTTRKDLNKLEVAIGGHDAVSIASTLDEAGIDPLSPGYSSMTNWILSPAQSPHTEVAAYCINAFGMFRNHSQVAVALLRELAQSERRVDENERITLRAIAFRMLARLSTDLRNTTRDISFPG